MGNAQTVDVTFPNGNRYTAKVIGNDIYSDIAVLQILQNASQPQRQLLSYLKPLALGNSSNLEVGDQVIAIGNPFGLSDTMTTGIASGVGRSLPASPGGFSIPNVIQTQGWCSTQDEITGHFIHKSHSCFPFSPSLIFIIRLAVELKAMLGSSKIMNLVGPVSSSLCIQVRRSPNLN